MIEEIRYYKGKMSVAQKIRFFEFCLKIYTQEIQVIDDATDLFDFGFCNLFQYYFDVNSNNFELIPELLKHKPDIFYDYVGTVIDDDGLFWFPPTENMERTMICKSILKELKK